MTLHWIRFEENVHIRKFEWMKKKMEVRSFPQHKRRTRPPFMTKLDCKQETWKSPDRNWLREMVVIKKRIQKGGGLSVKLSLGQKICDKRDQFSFFGEGELSVCLQVGSNVSFGGWNCAFSKFERFQPEKRDGKLLSESCHLAAILRTTYQRHIVKCYKNRICC